MNYVISIINPMGAGLLSNICEQLELPVALTFISRGTATKNMMNLLGIETKDRRVVIAVADEEKTKAMIREQRKRLYIDAPGNGVVVSVPIKSVGGGKTLAYLSGRNPKKSTPELNYEYELIVVIANEGHTDTVMDAARAAGAAGGTVLHGKGEGSKSAEKFFKVSIAKEMDMTFIVAKADTKAAIMRSVLKYAGPDTEAEAIVFSLPVNHIAGFSLVEELAADDEE